MKLYWPMAEVKDQSVFGNKLWTYEGTADRATAEKTFFYWALSGYRITKAWIEVRDGDDIIETIPYYDS